MSLKETTRFKDGKEQHYWSLVENRRVEGGRKVLQRHVVHTFWTPGQIFGLLCRL